MKLTTDRHEASRGLFATADPYQTEASNAEGMKSRDF